MSAHTLSTIRNFDNITAEIQDESQATLCKKIKKSDGEVDFEDASLMYNKYRAFEGWPGIFSTNGTKLEGLSIVDTTSDNRVLEILAFDEVSVVIGCRKGALKIGSLQPASKKAMSAKAYCAGRGMKVGDTLL